jgi:hypothetical protein
MDRAPLEDKGYEARPFWCVILFRGGGSKDFVGGCHRSCVITDGSWPFTKGGTMRAGD